MGTPVALGKTLQKSGVDVNAFFPSATTIHVGDSVKFVPVGFHTANFPKRGAKAAGLISKSGTAAANSSDAAGAPFWFNGQPNYGFNPVLFKGLFGKSATYTGAKDVNTGLPLSNKPKPATIKFTKAGSFTYYCSVHPGMKGTVRVVAKTKSVPSAKADAARVASQIAAAKKTAKALPQTKPAANSVVVGPQGKGGTEYLGFAPGSLSVAPGTTVTFSMSTAGYDEHTVTFGPGDPEQASTYLGKLAASFNGAPTFDPAAIYPSDPPSTTATLNPSLHGNGFWNAGVLFGGGHAPAGFQSFRRVTFDTPGTYTYYCLIHPFMKGTVTVK